MTQSDGVYPALTVAENVRFFAAAYGVRDPADPKHADLPATATFRASMKELLIFFVFTGGRRK